MSDVQINSSFYAKEGANKSKKLLAHKVFHVRGSTHRRAGYSAKSTNKEHKSSSVPLRGHVTKS